MSLAEIQSAVNALPIEERKRLTAWMVDQYPILSVDKLMARAQCLVDTGEWHPEPPGPDNTPSGAALARAIEVADRLGIK